MARQTCQHEYIAYSVAF